MIKLLTCEKSLVRIYDNIPLNRETVAVFYDLPVDYTEAKLLFCLTWFDTITVNVIAQEI